MRAVKAKLIRKLALKAWTDMKRKDQRLSFRKVYKTLKRSYKCKGFEVGRTYVKGKSGKIKIN